MMGNKNTIKRNKRGFTIIELMIATTVFSIVLVTLTYGVLAIGRMYYKSITSSRTQEISRAIIEDVSRSLQLNIEDRVQAGSGNFTAKAYCIGNLRYSYIIDRQVTGNNHGLWVDEKSSSQACAPVNLNIATPSANGRELIPENMRLTQFDVSAASNGIYNVGVAVAYGADDLLTTYTSTIPATRVVTNEAQAAGALCKGGVGSSFCAVSSLNVAVKKRL